MISDVWVEPLRVISDSRGRIQHFMRKTDPIFIDFNVQEVYFSFIYPGAIKAWHRHKKMTLNYVVPVGNIKLVLYDQRANSPTAYELQEIYLGENCPYQLVRIPPMVWNGFMVVDGKTALVANITDFVHDPKEIERMSIGDFCNLVYLYDWHQSFNG